MKNVVKINVELYKYNKSVVPRNLIDYITEQAMEYKLSTNFKIVVSKKDK